jgi:hypothetical protein
LDWFITGITYGTFPVKLFYLLKMDAQPYNFPAPIIPHRAANEQKSNLYLEAIIGANPVKSKKHEDPAANYHDYQGVLYIHTLRFWNQILSWRPCVWIVYTVTYALLVLKTSHSSQEEEHRRHIDARQT